MFVVLEMQLQIYGHLLKTKRAHHVESTLIRRRYYFDTSKTKFRRISTSFPCTFFDVISLVEKSSLFPRTFFGVISLVKISTLFPCILFDVISLVEISTFFYHGVYLHVSTYFFRRFCKLMKIFEQVFLCVCNLKQLTFARLFSLNFEVNLSGVALFH